MGSTVTTVARQPRCSRASPTSATSTAHTAQILSDDKIGIEASERAFVETVALLTCGDPHLHLCVDLAGDRPSGNVELDTMRRFAPFRREVALEGHTDDVVAGAYSEQISVVEGSSETIRTQPGWGGLQRTGWSARRAQKGSMRPTLGGSRPPRWGREHVAAVQPTVVQRLANRHNVGRSIT